MRLISHCYYLVPPPTWSLLSLLLLLLLTLLSLTCCCIQWLESVLNCCHHYHRYRTVVNKLSHSNRPGGSGEIRNLASLEQGEQVQGHGRDSTFTFYHYLWSHYGLFIDNLDKEISVDLEISFPKSAWKFTNHKGSRLSNFLNILFVYSFFNNYYFMLSIKL